MSKSSRGFFLAELLLSLAALLIITMTLVPMILQLNEQRSTSKLQHEARKLLFEQLLVAEIQNTTIEERTIERNKFEFIIKKQYEDGKLEVCAFYGENEKVCEFVY